MNENSSGVSERLFQQGVYYFINHPDKWISRSEIQEALNIGKTQACKLCQELERRIYLTAKEQKKENSPLWLMLESEHMKSATKELLSISTLTEDDRRILTILMNMADSSGLYGDMVKSLKSHIALARFSERGIIPILNFSPDMQISEENKKFLPVVFQAIEQGKSVWITYKSHWSGDEKTYTVNPIGVFTQNEILYLFSYNPYFNDTVVHAFSRIRNIDLYIDSATPEEFKDLNRVMDPFGIAVDENPTTATVWIDHYQAPFEMELKRSKEAQITEHKDGSITMTITTHNKFALKRWIMSLGRQARCTDPPELVKEIRAEIDAAKANYPTD